MADLNIVHITGNIGRDAEMSYVGQKQTALCKFGVATKAYSGKEGEGKTTWHDVQCWGITAEIASTFKRGDRVMVYGSYEENEWDGTDGKKHKKKFVLGKVVARLERERGGRKADDASRPESKARQEPPPLDDSEAPF
jgi:single-strand DNA-binding protein